MSVRPEYSFDVVVKIIVLKDIAAQFLLQTRKVGLLSLQSKIMVVLCQNIYSTLFHIRNLVEFGEFLKVQEFVFCGILIVKFGLHDK